MAEQKDTKSKAAVVIYRPSEGDPHTTFIRYGEREEHQVRFRANEPVEVLHSITVSQLLREERETPDGIRARSVERKVPLVDMLKTNPSFEVDGQRAERKAPLARLPDTPDQYRNYAVMWITASMSARAMDQRWEAEAGLRSRCGVGPEDISYIRPLFDARRKECADLDAQRAA